MFGAPRITRTQRQAIQALQQCTQALTWLQPEAIPLLLALNILIEVAKSKINQLGAAEGKAIFYSPDFQLCPIRPLQAWLQRLDRTQGPVFISFHKGGWLPERRLTNRPLNRIVQRYPGSKFSAHSLRASFVTVAKLAGADNLAVMNQTKYKTSEMIRCYTPT